MINRVVINGYLGKNPEVKKTNTGKSVCNFSICQSRKDQSGNQISKWFQIIAWDKTADFLGLQCKKGDMIIIEGHMDYREYEKDGQRRSLQEIVAETITFGRRGNNHTETQPAAPSPQPQPTYMQQSMTNGANVPSDFGIPEYNIEIGSDDLPF